MSILAIMAMGVLTVMTGSDREYETWLSMLERGKGYSREWIRRNETLLRREYEAGRELPIAAPSSPPAFDRYGGL